MEFNFQIVLYKSKDILQKLQYKLKILSKIVNLFLSNKNKKKEKKQKNFSNLFFLLYKNKL